MKKMIIFIVCCMCLLVVGCEKQAEVIDISGEIINMQVSQKEDKKINIIEKIKIPDFEYDWETEINKYPLDEKVLCYEGDFNQGNEKNKISVYFKGYGYNDYLDYFYEIKINDVFLEEISDCLCIIDMDSNDDYIEFVIDDFWENGGFHYVYRYINNEITCIGSLKDIFLEDYFCNENRFFSKYEIIHFGEETLIPRYYILENGELTYKLMKYDEVKDKTYTVTQDMLTEIECYDKLKVGDKIKILNYHDETDNITGESQGLELRVMNESGEIFNIGYVGSCM